MNPIARRASPRDGLLGVLGRAALAIVLAGAGASLGLMLYAGRHNKSRILLLLFAVWVLSPFTITIWANRVSKGWSIPAQATLNVVILVLALGSMAIYGQ